MCEGDRRRLSMRILDQARPHAHRLDLAAEEEWHSRTDVIHNLI